MPYKLDFTQLRSVIIPWTTLMYNAGIARTRDAPLLLHRLLLLRPASTFSSASPNVDIDPLYISSNAKSISQTKQAHAFGLLKGFLPYSVSLCTSLILSYATFRDPVSFRLLFELTVRHCRTSFLWNTLIRAHSIAGVCDGFETYNRMVRAGVRPDDHTFPIVLKVCSDFLDIGKGMEIHGVVFKLGFDSDVYVGNTLSMLYGNCEDWDNAKKVFDEMPERDVVSWNTIIGLLSVNGSYEQALNIFFEMISGSELKPDLVSLVSILPVCAELEDKAMTSQIHCYAVKAGFDLHVTICNALVDAYGKGGNVKASKQAFFETTDKNVVSWNAIITSLAYKQHNKDAIEVFRSMIHAEIRPNSLTISTILHVLVDLEQFKAGKEIHGFSLRTIMEDNIVILNSLIDMYGKSGQSDNASNVFYNMVERNVFSWNYMIANYAQNGFELEAIRLIMEMQALGEAPNSVTFTNVLPACARLGFLSHGQEIHAKTIRSGLAIDLFVSNFLTDMYAKCGRIALARNVFNVSFRNEVSFNILILGYCQTTDCSESLSLFSEMRIADINPDIISFAGIISACANLAAAKQGRAIHGVLVRKLFSTHLFLSNSLLEFYTKCGRIDLAGKVFDKIPNKDVASWNTMILGYGMLGELESAIDLFEKMKEASVQYDSVSYIAVLSACSHGGLVEEGQKYFEGMEARKIQPTLMHYACMVDLLGRAGLIEEAVELIKGLPITPDFSIWGALLGACRVHENVEIGRWAAEHLLALKPNHSGYYILLSNMYAELGRWDEAHMVRDLMKSRKVKKNPGCSWVQIQDQVHAFIAGEKLEKLYSD